MEGRIQEVFEINQPWDPLRVCVVGQSYPPEFYQWIQNSRLRSMFERIAVETEEDYQLLIKTLRFFGVEIIRPKVPNFLDAGFISSNNRIPGPVGMTPRDKMTMIGNRFFMFPETHHVAKASGRIQHQSSWDTHVYNDLKGPDWPENFTQWEDLPDWIRRECTDYFDFVYHKGEDIDELAEKSSSVGWWDPIKHMVAKQNNPVFSAMEFPALNLIPANGITVVGRDLYFGWAAPREKDLLLEKITKNYFPDYRCHLVWTGGHIDGVFAPVVPGLIVSTHDVTTFQDTFPGWQVVYLANESWNKVKGWTALKRKNNGRWWIKDAHNDAELVNFVELWLKHWTGFVEESVFDVNMLTIDEKNVIVSSTNDIVLRVFNEYGITAHVCPFRHRYFWDGGIHCVTSDLHRDGMIKDYFPQRAA